MKLLYTVIISVLIQVTLVKPNNSTKTSLEVKLKELHDHEVQILTKEFAAKAKILSENVLEDEIVQMAATTDIQEFKSIMTDFLELYPAYERFELYPDLSILFESKIPLVNNNLNKDSLYISELLRKQGYYEINSDYERKFEEFVHQKFLPKYEELKAQLSPEELEQEQNFINWFREFRKCENYDCYYKYLTVIPKNPKERLFEFIRDQLISLNIFYAQNMYNILKAVLKDPNLSQVSLELKENLIENINNILRQYENNHNIDKLNDISQDLYQNVILKFYYNKTIPLKDEQLIQQIFIDQGYVKFDERHQKKYNDFVDYELEKKFEEIKTQLNPEELLKIKPFFQWFHQLKSLKSYVERVADFEKVYDIEYI